MLCSSYLFLGFFCATPDAYSALCLVLHCTAPLDVSKSLTRMAQQHQLSMLLHVGSTKGRGTVQQGPHMAADSAERVANGGGATQRVGPEAAHVARVHAEPRRPHEQHHGR